MSEITEMELFTSFRPTIQRLSITGYFPFKIHQEKSANQTLYSLRYVKLRAYLYSCVFILTTTGIFAGFAVEISPMITGAGKSGKFRILCYCFSVILAMCTVLFFQIRIAVAHGRGLVVWQTTVRLITHAKSHFDCMFFQSKEFKRIQKSTNRRMLVYLVMGLMQLCAIFIIDGVEREKDHDFFGILAYGIYEILVFLHQGYSTSILGYMAIYSTCLVLIKTELERLISSTKAANISTIIFEKSKQSPINTYPIPDQSTSLLKTTVSTSTTNERYFNFQLEKILQFFDAVEKTLEYFSTSTNAYFTTEFFFQIHFFLLKTFFVVSLAVNAHPEAFNEFCKSIAHIIIAVLVVHSLTSRASVLEEELENVFASLVLVHRLKHAQMNRATEWKVK